MLTSHRIIPSRAAGWPHEGRVVGFGRRELLGGAESDFYVELRKPSGESVVFEGEGVRAAAEALGVDVGHTVIIEASSLAGPRIVRSRHN